jgi:putative endonuclease
MASRREIGEAGERAAEDHLRRLRYQILERNYRCKGGEIDLVALHRGTVVFVEVRTRAAGAMVHPFESVDAHKRRRIVNAARHYVSRNRLHDHPQRFDLVAVRAAGDRMECEHLRNAFDLQDLPPPRRRY